MTCHETRELFSALADGVLTPEEEARLRAHVAGCLDCGRELASFERTMQLLRAAEPVRAPAGFVDRVLEAARPLPWHRRLLRGLFVPWSLKLPLEAAAVVLVGVMAAAVYRHTPELQYATRAVTPPPSMESSDQTALASRPESSEESPRSAQSSAPPPAMGARGEPAPGAAPEASREKTALARPEAQQGPVPPPAVATAPPPVAPAPRAMADRAAESQRAPLPAVAPTEQPRTVDPARESRPAPAPPPGKTPPPDARHEVAAKATPSREVPAASEALRQGPPPAEGRRDPAAPERDAKEARAEALPPSPPSVGGSAPGAARLESRKQAVGETGASTARARSAPQGAVERVRAQPHVAGRLAVGDRVAARRALTELAARVGGAEIASGASTDVVEIVIPRTAWDELATELARLGRFTAERQPAQLPADVHVAIRLE